MTHAWQAQLRTNLTLCVTVLPSSQCSSMLLVRTLCGVQQEMPHSPLHTRLVIGSGLRHEPLSTVYLDLSPEQVVPIERESIKYYSDWKRKEKNTDLCSGHYPSIKDAISYKPYKPCSLSLREETALLLSIKWFEDLKIKTNTQVMNASRLHLDTDSLHMFLWSIQRLVKDFSIVDFQ